MVPVHYDSSAQTLSSDCWYVFAFFLIFMATTAKKPRFVGYQRGVGLCHSCLRNLSQHTFTQSLLLQYLLQGAIHEVRNNEKTIYIRSFLWVEMSLLCYAHSTKNEQTVEHLTKHTIKHVCNSTEGRWGYKEWIERETRKASYFWKARVMRLDFSSFKSSHSSKRKRQKIPNIGASEWEGALAELVSGT